MVRRGDSFLHPGATWREGSRGTSLAAVSYKTIMKL